MTRENTVREEICELGRSLFERGLTTGSTGNLSARLEDGGYLMTPTNSCLGSLDPAKLSRLDAEQQWIDGDKPSKEDFMHFAMYRAKSETGSVVHLHSTYSVLLSCLSNTNPDDMIPRLTPYVLMKVGYVARVPFYPPGDKRQGPAIEEKAKVHNAIIIANHGPLVASRSIREAVFAMEEVEESAKLAYLLRNEEVTHIPDHFLQSLL